MLESEEQKSNRVIKYLNKSVDDFMEFIEKKYGIKLNKDYSDFIPDLECPWGVNFDGVYISCDENFQQFEVGYWTYDNESYREPPSDYSEYSKRSNIHDALFDVMVIHVRFQYNCYKESLMGDY